MAVNGELLMLSSGILLYQCKTAFAKRRFRLNFSSRKRGRVQHGNKEAVIWTTKMFPSTICTIVRCYLMLGVKKTYHVPARSMLRFHSIRNLNKWACHKVAGNRICSVTLRPRVSIINDPGNLWHCEVWHKQCVNSKWPPFNKNSLTQVVPQTQYLRSFLHILYKTGRTFNPQDGLKATLGPKLCPDAAAVNGTSADHFMRDAHRVGRKQLGWGKKIIISIASMHT